MALLKRGRGGISNQLQIATRGLPLVPRRSDFDWLRAGHSSSGSRPGSTRSSMLRAARGCLLMKPSRSSVSTIW
jgi:hypothetical protein